VDEAVDHRSGGAARLSGVVRSVGVSGWWWRELVGNAVV
jgi:hypothetical protein